MGEEVFASKSAMNLYMEEVRNFPTIEEEELKELGKMLKVEETREYAKNRLIEGNLRLVVKMAHSWKGKGLGIDDLVCVGNKALIMAAENFDIDCGKSFATYAIWKIRPAMSRAVSASHNIRIPVASELKKRNVQRFVDTFKANFDREPTKEEIQKGMGLSNVEMKNVLNLENSCVSMNAKFDNTDENSDEIGDIVANSLETKSVLDEIVNNEEISDLYKAIKMLDEREKTVIIMRYGFGRNRECTLDEVAEKIGKTKERVRQIQKTAEAKLKMLMLKFAE